MGYYWCGTGNSCLELGLQYRFAQCQVQNLSISITGQSWQLLFLGEASKDVPLQWDQTKQGAGAAKLPTDGNLFPGL